MSRFSFTLDEHSGCGACGVTLNQSSPPELRYVVDKSTGKGASVQCCLKCCREIDLANRTMHQVDTVTQKTDRLEELERQIKEKEAKLAELIKAPETLTPIAPLQVVPKLEKIAEVKATAKPKKRRKRRRNARIKDVV